MKSLFDVGDIVTLREIYHPKCEAGDYPYNLSQNLLDSWGGKQGKITEVVKNALDDFTELYIEEWVYCVDFGDTNNPSTIYHFPALAFKECNCITPGRRDWNVLWTRRYPDVVFYRIEKNATMRLDIPHSLSGSFIFDRTPEGGDFWDKVYNANMKQLKECVTWLKNKFPQDFFITASTTFINNFTINQDENQLQGTKINLGRDENQRGTICVYPKDRPRVTICPISYTAVGYRNGINISRCKN